MLDDDNSSRDSNNNLIKSVILPFVAQLTHFPTNPEASSFRYFNQTQQHQSDSNVPFTKSNELETQSQYTALVNVNNY